MNWKEFFEHIVGHLAWPIVILILAFAVRKHLGSLAERILELSFGGATVKFGKLLSKGAEIIDETEDKNPPPPPEPIPVPEPGVPPPNPPFAPRDQDTTMTSPSPMTVPYSSGNSFNSVFNIFSAYDATEKLLGDIGGQLGVKTRSGPTIIRMLRTRGLLSDELLELYFTLRNARNAVAHGKSPTPNEGETAEFVRQAIFLNQALHRILFDLRKK